MIDFVHLHVHTEYSMLDGLGRIDKLIKKAQEHGQKALAITDHGGMYGAVHFYNSCKKAGIKPIIGVEVYMAKKSRFDKQTRMGSDQSHLVLLAMNHQGYVNLMHLVSFANLEGFSYKPRIDFELLEKYNSDIITTSGCPSSIFNRLLRDGKKEQALEWFKKFKKLFGDRFYIELQRHEIDFIEDLNKELVSISRELDIPLVATNDVHYVEANEAYAQDALICVQTHKLISEKKRMSMLDSPSFYLRSSEEMSELFHDYPEAIENTTKVANRCNIKIPTGQLIFPNYPIPKGKTTEEFLKEMTLKGLKKRFKKITQEHLDRVDYELNIITGKGYSTYFLITQDFVNWAKDQGIAVGPGRGSAAGSLVSYAIGITDIDPLIHGLPFERFLNPERPTPPDIDIDFADDRRDEVIKYAADTYGHDHVAQVITFGRMEARVAIRDIGRVLGMPYEDPDRIAKLIPNHPGTKTSLSLAIKTVPDLAAYYQQPKFKKLIDLAMKVEGVIRHSSVHAAAVVIADKSLMNYTPIQRENKSGKTVTQYDMYVLDCNISNDAIGLLKFDFLGLRNLSTIQMAVQLIKEYKNINIDLSKIPIDDKKTFDLISTGETTGIFQLESAGMRRVARTLRPNQFSDITAMVALYRPGPMDLIPQFIEGKHNPEKVVYPHESLRKILEETYGVMVYQEQILQIANKMAGYTLGEADILRQAIGKKKKKLLDENKKRFIRQSVENKYAQQVAEKVWGFIEAFANYGFNKAHAASYAMIAYQTAYLKANYPVEYMAALMSIESASHSMNRDIKVAQAIEASKQMGIKILPPDINASKENFTIENHSKSLQNLAIRFGLSAVKHVGTAAITNILETRKKNNEKFTSLTQFIQETEGRKVNKKTLEVLIQVGAMHQFGTRASMLENLDQTRDKATQFQSNVDGQDNLFADIAEQVRTLEDTFPNIPEYPKQELLSFEKKYLGLFLTEHPLADSLSAVSRQASKKISEIDLSIHNEQSFIFGGVITSLKKVRTKKNNKEMAFGNLEDETGRAEFVVFPRTFTQFSNLLAQDNVILIKAKVDDQDGELKLIVEKIIAPNQLGIRQAKINNAHEVFIPRKTNKSILEDLGKLLKKNKGDDKVVILIPNGEKPKKMLLPYGVEWSKELEKEIQGLLNN
ncbi:DNA polymerase III subunit alpha [Patescibacteria group bacterium]|nr:DNA polymerase III subunit alpha [Patescibacteria group bacterium]